MGIDESSDVRGAGPPNEGRAPNISAGPSTASPHMTMGGGKAKTGAHSSM